MSEIILTPEDKECMERAKATVLEAINDEGWKYDYSELRPDVVCYDLAFGMEFASIHMKVYVEADPNVCRIKAILPIVADKIYEYPLCLHLANVNYKKRFGCFKYDEEDGEITYEYSTLLDHGIDKEDFLRYFRAVLNTADDEYPEIRKHCVGKYKRSQMDDILAKIQKLVEDLDD